MVDIKQQNNSTTPKNLAFTVSAIPEETDHISDRDNFNQFKVKDDYQFKISELFDFQKFEEQNKKNLRDKKNNNAYNRKIQMRDKYIGIDVEELMKEGEQGFQTGLFSELKLTFKATEDLINQNYINETQQSIQKTKMFSELEYLGKDISDIKISYNSEKHLLEEMLNKVNAYKQLIVDTNREFYLKRIRLRSIASQYVSFVPLLEDGHFFPFLIFSVLDVKSGEKRMLELDFVEDVFQDRYKDHCTRSYHFSMIKRVNKGISITPGDGGDDIFHIEFNNEKHHYRAIVPNQRDLIVGLITVAVEETQITQNMNKSNTNPTNVNFKKDKFSQLAAHRTENSLKLKVIMDDFVLPTKAVKTGVCEKKNEKWGTAKRYLLLGVQQLIIARDPEFQSIVAVVPLEGGFCLVKLAKKNETSLDYKRTVLLITLERRYDLMFKNDEEAKSWSSFIHMVISKQIKNKPFLEKVHIQQKQLSEYNKVHEYKELHADIVLKLNSVKSQLDKKNQIEKENYKEIVHLQPRDNWNKLRELISKIGFQLQDQGKALQDQENPATPKTKLSHKVITPTAESSTSSTNDDQERVMYEAGTDKYLMTTESYKLYQKIKQQTKI